MSGSVEPTNWRKSLHSGGQAECVEVADSPEVGMIRDTKDPDSGTLTFQRTAFDVFLRMVASA